MRVALAVNIIFLVFPSIDRRTRSVSKLAGPINSQMSRSLQIMQPLPSREWAAQSVHFFEHEMITLFRIMGTGHTSACLTLFDNVVLFATGQTAI